MALFLGGCPDPDPEIFETESIAADFAVTPQRIEWAEPLQPVGSTRTWLDRYWVWTAVAVGLVLIAYAYPLWVHLQMPRFGSPGFKPF